MTALPNMYWTVLPFHTILAPIQIRATDLRLKVCTPGSLRNAAHGGCRRSQVFNLVKAHLQDIF